MMMRSEAVRAAAANPLFRGAVLAMAGLAAAAGPIGWPRSATTPPTRIRGGAAAKPGPSVGTVAFLSARPVWPAGRETEKNLTVGFRAVFDRPAAAGETVLRITASSIYRAFLNGAFLAYGPARGPHGFHRVDEIPLGPLLRDRGNVLALEVVGYNVNSYYLPNQPAFLQAEVAAGGRAVASTGKGGAGRFEARVLTERVRKVQRFSFQRPFMEIYRLSPGFDAWRGDAAVRFDPAADCAEQPAKPLLPRRVRYPEYAPRTPAAWIAGGELRPGLRPAKLWRDRSLTDIGPKLGGYPQGELEEIPSIELQTIGSVVKAAPKPVAPAGAVRVAPGTFRIADFGLNDTGFLGARVTARTDARLVFTFDEILTDGDVDFKRLGCVNAVVLELRPGTYDFESIEPNTFRYLKVAAIHGDCDVERLALREYAAPVAPDATFHASDERLDRLFAAGRETYRQNAVDLFTDCPHRERAGWLCDSFFTARVAADLQGDARVERAFLENYALPASFADIPDGMLPMCYPADHDDGVFIPNWAMWFVVELEEYLARSGDRALVDALRPRVLKLLDYLAAFRNSDGLLEKLPSWVFVEWSKANDFVQDVNYPSNMLYAATLAAAGRLYALPALGRDAARVRDAVRRQSFDGEFFVDNAVRAPGGALRATTNRTEVCQDFAFFFDVATPESHPALWRTLLDEFGPRRRETEAHPEVHPANAFIGNVLRLELLSRAGRTRQLLDESVAYQLYMADRTGTLWENDGAYASCNHGFASHGGVRALYRDVLGIAGVDRVRKTVAVRLTDSGLERCEGSVPTADGPVSLRWRRDGATLRYRIAVPAGWTASVANASGLAIAEEKPAR